MLLLYLAIGLGGALGSMARFGLAGWVESQVGSGIPWGTLLVNVLGSLAIGWAFYALAPEGKLAISPTAKQLFTVGFCGGFTTFSSYSLQLLAQIHRGEWQQALLYAVGSVVLCLGAVWVGYTLANWGNAPR